MEDDDKGWRFLRDLYSQRLQRLLDGDMRNALIWQARQQQALDKKVDLEEETELLLRAYLQLLEAEEKCEQLIARKRGQTEFWALVRAAAEARARMEQVEHERNTGGGFFEGVAAAIEERNARARERLRADDEGGGGEVGAALELAPTPPEPISDYDRMVAETRAMRAAAKKPFPKIIIDKSNDETGPGWP